MHQAAGAAPDTPALERCDVGFIGVGALASALVQAFARASLRHGLHLSPRGEAASTALARQTGARRHTDNQSVLDTCRMVVIGVRPGQLQSLAGELRLTAQHHLIVLSAGTPLVQLQAWFGPARVTRAMTGLAVAGGHTAISLFPPSAEAEVLLRPAAGTVLACVSEGHFDASVLAVCANAWWLDQLGVLTQWMVRYTGMPPEQAHALLCANMADAASLALLRPHQDLRAMARTIGTPGTYTAAGLTHLEAVGAHRHWEDALAGVLQQMQTPAAAKRKRPAPPIPKT